MLSEISTTNILYECLKSYKTLEISSNISSVRRHSVFPSNNGRLYSRNEAPCLESLLGLKLSGVRVELVYTIPR